MFEVVVDCIRYIRDIPVELTEEAVEAGALGKGSVVGLLIHPPSDPVDKARVEVRITREGQEKLLKPGLRITLEDRYKALSDNIYCITSMI